MIAAIAQQGLALLPYHRANMIDLNQILAGMAAAIQSSDFPNASEMAASLGLDLSTATVTVTRSGAIAIIGARFPALPTAEVEVAGAARPRKTLDLAFFNSAIPVGPYVEAAARGEQRIERSKHGEGLAILFTVDGFDCGMTASGRDGVVETLFCAAPAMCSSLRATLEDQGG
jgi:hypothetical protein